MAGAISFTAIFHFAYLWYLWPTFGIFWLSLLSPSIAMSFLAYGLAVVPSQWMPIRLTRGSHLVYWILYLTVFIPSMVVSVMVDPAPGWPKVLMLVAFLLGFRIVTLSDRLPLVFPRRSLVPHETIAIIVLAATVGIALYLALLPNVSLRLVSFNPEEHYRQRSVNPVGIITGYLSFWLPNVLNPFLLTYGLVMKRWFYFLVGAIGQIFAYSFAATKGSVLSVAIYIAIYWFVRKGSQRFGTSFVWAATLLIVSALAVSTIETEGPWTFFPSIVLMRTFGVPGLLTSQYDEFFKQHPFTYLSHMNIMNEFVNYPYSRPLPIEVGYYYYGTDTSANAHLWAQDGIAAFGTPGIILISGLCAIVLWMLDSVSARHDLLFTATSLTFVSIELANSSLSTSLVSGGILFYMAVFVLMSPLRAMRPHARRKAKHVTRLAMVGEVSI